MDDMAPDGTKFDGQHLRYNLRVYINPAVAKLPKHQVGRSPAPPMFNF
jgi:hypothetical protein